MKAVRGRDSSSAEALDEIQNEIAPGFEEPRSESRMGAERKDDAVGAARGKRRA